jgi:hypothetical protein
MSYQVQQGQQGQQAETQLKVTRNRRPALVTFAAVMMFILSAFYLIASITEWSNSLWLYSQSFSVGGSRIVFWGFVDFVLACFTAWVAFALLDGRRGGQIWGFVFAGISLVRWLFYVPADPWLAVSIMTIDALVIYGLAVNDEWFARL